MNLKSLSKSLVIILSIFYSPNLILSNESNFNYGITGGYLLAQNDVKYLNVDEGCVFLRDFVSNSYFIGLTSEYKNKFFLDFSIKSKIKYNSFTFSQSQEQDPLAVLVESNDGVKSIYTTTAWQWFGKYSLLSFELIPKIIVPYTDLGIYSGVSFSYLIYSDYNEHYSLIGPKDDIIKYDLKFKRNEELIAKYKYKYINDDRTIVLKDGEFPDKNPFRLGYKIGLDYSFKYSDFEISPFVEMDFPLTSVLDNFYSSEYNKFVYYDYFHWEITYFYAGIDIKYNF